METTASGSPVSPISTTIAPWLSVSDAAEAIEFYRSAFGAIEAYRLDGEAGWVEVALLTVDGAPFWLQHDGDAKPGKAAGGAVRMILTVADPDALFERATAAGATVIASIHEEYGWRSGRVVDPFGYEWEFSRPLSG
jgi:PhnB protein